MKHRTSHPLTRRRLLRNLPAGALMLHAVARGQQDKRRPGTTRVLIGTSGRGSEGIYAAYLVDGALQPPMLVAPLPNPSFLALPQANPSFVFAVTQPESTASAASSFQHRPVQDTHGDTLPHVSDASSTGLGGCHISTTRNGSCVFVANYGGGSLASFRADAQGKLSLATLIAYPGDSHGPQKDRQDKSYVHSIQPAPGEQFVIASNLGLDRIHILRLDRATATLTKHGEFLTRPGSGPRHMVFHSNGRWVYSINELNSSIDLLDWDATAGTLKLRNIVSTLPHYVDAVGKRACEMVFSPDEKFLYASNRVHEDFAAFRVDPQTGLLGTVQHLPNSGKESRHIAIDPSGRYFLTANQFSDDVTVYAIDPVTGKLGASTGSIKLGGPSCLVFG